MKWIGMTPLAGQVSYPGVDVNSPPTTGGGGREWSLEAPRTVVLLFCRRNALLALPLVHGTSPPFPCQPSTSVQDNVQVQAQPVSLAAALVTPIPALAVMKQLQWQDWLSVTSPRGGGGVG